MQELQGNIAATVLSNSAGGALTTMTTGWFTAVERVSALALVNSATTGHIRPRDEHASRVRSVCPHQLLLIHVILPSVRHAGLDGAPDVLRHHSVQQRHVVLPQIEVHLTAEGLCPQWFTSSDCIET